MDEQYKMDSSANNTVMYLPRETHEYLFFILTCRVCTKAITIRYCNYKAISIFDLPDSQQLIL